MHFLLYAQKQALLIQRNLLAAVLGFVRDEKPSSSVSLNQEELTLCITCCSPKICEILCADLLPVKRPVLQAHFRSVLTRL